MFLKPKIYYNNALRTALEGDDGTAYATCPKAIKYPLDSSKLLGVITPITDISSLSQLRGSVIKFTTTGNQYRVTDMPTYPGLPSASNWQDIAWNGSVFCAVASGPSTVAATSQDGITWTARTLPSSSGWVAIAWNGTVFCAIANGSTAAATSLDGITWTARTLPSSSNWVAIAWNGTVFCAITTGSLVAATSFDGITWPRQILSLYESLQDADIGGSFSFRI
jgi:hypothetical protein